MEVSDVYSIPPVNTWEEYASLTFEGKSLYNLFKIAASPAFRVYYCRPNRCVHHEFKDEELLLLCLFKMSIDNPTWQDVVLSQGISKNSLRHGLCSQCAQKFIVFTNNLSFIFDQFPIIKMVPLKHDKSLLADRRMFRAIFRCTRSVMELNPLFLRCTLLKSNALCLGQIFETFFIK